MSKLRSYLLFLFGVLIGASLATGIFLSIFAPFKEGTQVLFILLGAFAVIVISIFFATEGGK